MTFKKLFSLALLFALLLPAGFAWKGSSNLDFNRLVDSFFDDVYFHFSPTLGTVAGFHQYDTALENFSSSSRAEQIAKLRNYKEQFEKRNAAGGKTNSEQASDIQLILNYINATLLELENIRGWEKNPDLYSTGVSSSAYSIMAREFAPADVRLRSLIAREKQMPATFDAARANLKNPPRVFTEVALEQLPGIVGFFEKDVPLAFKEVKDKKLLAEFGESNAHVVEALRAYQKFLENDLLPKADGDFRLGAENFSKALLYQEMVDIPLDKLLEIGMADLRKNQKWFTETAAKLDPKKTWQQVLEDINKDHPTPEQLIPAFKETLAGEQAFIRERKIVTIPPGPEPIIQETPAFARALTFASMDSPGPYEKVGKQSYFNVTPPEKNWSKQEIEEHMQGFSYAAINNTAVHEAYPGHYLQYLWQPFAPSKTRKLLACNTNVEGWAHYGEQMMLDEGFGIPKGGDQDSPEFLKLRLGELEGALARDARFVVGLQMHTGKMTFDEGVQFFEKEGYLTHANAMRETRRGTSDPLYLYYTLGKLEIMKLREDAKRKLGSKFSLQGFHDSFLREGNPPIIMIRKEMKLGDLPSL